MPSNIPLDDRAITSRYHMKYRPHCCIANRACAQHGLGVISRKASGEHIESGLWW
jgi:hypothetical protein